MNDELKDPNLDELLIYEDNDLMPFGKHKGEKLKNVPAGYLLWIYDNLNLSLELKNYIKENLDELEEKKDEEESIDFWEDYRK